MANIVIRRDGDEQSFDCDEHENILGKAMELGISLPFSCMSGSCTACKGYLISGNVQMDITDPIEDEISQGAILTCQAKPRTAEVIIRID